LAREERKKLKSVISVDLNKMNNCLHGNTGRISSIRSLSPFLTLDGGGDRIGFSSRVD
jgi:hypothetical protein